MKRGNYIAATVAAITSLVIILNAGCKKKGGDNLPVTLSATITKDSAFTTTNVTTTNEGNGTVYIVAKGGYDQEIDMALTGVTGTKQTFKIDYRGVGGNITGNTLQYRKGSTSFMTTFGQMQVTSVSGNLMYGTFSAHFDYTDVEGTFTARLQ